MMEPFKCPRCEMTSERNMFGDIIDPRTRSDHPYLAVQQTRVCKPTFRQTSGGIILEAALAFKETLPDIRI